MRNYAPYLMYQLARFGALTVPQMLRICDGVCKRSSLYRALSELVDGKYVYPILNPASRTRGYYATKEGREWVQGTERQLTAGVRTQELDHTILCAEFLLDLCQFENIVGVATPFELGPDEIAQFCHERVPDGIFRLRQDGEHFEIALEVESSRRNNGRVAEVLGRYWSTFKHRMPCSGVLIAALDPTIYGMYSRSIATMPPEFQERVRLVRGDVLGTLRSEAYGQQTYGLRRCLDFTRTQSLDGIAYTPIKLEVFSPKTASQHPPDRGGGTVITDWRSL